MANQNLARADEHKSRWEFSKATSKWHFDRFRDEDLAPPFRILGRFKEGPWQVEFEDILRTTSTTPVTFGNRIASVVPGVEPYTTALDNHDLIRMGLGVNHQLYDRLVLPESAIWLRRMTAYFQMREPRAAIHVQYPGQVFPYHIDNLTGTRVNRAEHYIDEDPDAVVRIEIQLRDWDWGHVWAYGNTYWKQWRAGEIASHSWRDVPHGTANLGHTPRCVLQVTGYLTEFTRGLVQKKDLVIDLERSKSVSSSERGQSIREVP